MSIFAQSIKRLYDAGKLTRQEVQKRLTKKQITQQEFDAIIKD